MKGRKSRVARIGVLALALSITVGLVSGSVADAKKKGKKKSSSLVTVAATAPATVPPSVNQPAGCTEFAIPNPNPCTGPVIRSLVNVPLAVGKKAKGTVVSPASVSVTYTLSGPARVPGAGGGGPPAPIDPGTPAGTANLGLSLTAPNGRTIGLDTPGDPNATTVGPVTETANSPFSFCAPNFAFPFPETTSCTVEDPDTPVRPPTWAGTIGNPELEDFDGVPARGTWTVKVRNFSTQVAGTLSSVSLQIPLQAASPTGGGGKKK